MGKSEQALKNERSKQNDGANSIETFETVASTISKAPVLDAEVDVLRREKELIQ